MKFKLPKITNCMVIESISGYQITRVEEADINKLNRTVQENAEEFLRYVPDATPVQFEDTFRAILREAISELGETETFIDDYFDEEVEVQYDEVEAALDGVEPGEIIFFEGA